MRPTPLTDKLIAPLFCVAKKTPGVFTIEMELIDAPVPIKRILKIPENMNLGYVQEILMLAMGWEETAPTAVEEKPRNRWKNSRSETRSNTHWETF